MFKGTLEGSTVILSDKHDDFLLLVIPDGSVWIGETRFATGSTIAERHQEPLSCLRGVPCSQ